jgi:hypothetical protein
VAGSVHEVNPHQACTYAAHRFESAGRLPHTPVAYATEEAGGDLDRSAGEALELRRIPCSREDAVVVESALEARADVLAYPGRQCVAAVGDVLVRS